MVIAGLVSTCRSYWRTGANIGKLSTDMHEMFAGSGMDGSVAGSASST
jgi:hypothetical protein